MIKTRKFSEENEMLEEGLSTVLKRRWDGNVKNGRKRDIEKDIRKIILKES